MAKTLSDQIRAAVKNAPCTQYQISQATGISQSNLSRFVRGKAGLSLPSLDLLCAALELEIVQRKPKHGKRL
jgi:transcriptional regulator with XRE-family HTH domain